MCLTLVLAFVNVVDTLFGRIKDMSCHHHGSDYAFCCRNTVSNGLVGS